MDIYIYIYIYMYVCARARACVCKLAMCNNSPCRSFLEVVWIEAFLRIGNVGQLYKQRDAFHYICTMYNKIIFKTIKVKYTAYTDAKLKNAKLYELKENATES